MYVEKADEYALSKDVDVAVWLQYRAYNKQPPLRDTGDFVMVNLELHDDFDDFRSKELEPEYSYLEMTELLRHYLKNMPHISPSTMERYGNTYLRVHVSEMDDLCDWVEELRENHSQIGNEAFSKGK
jgi:hypothetical protein